MDKKIKLTDILNYASIKIIGLLVSIILETGCVWFGWNVCFFNAFNVNRISFVQALLTSIGLAFISAPVRDGRK